MEGKQFSVSRGVSIAVGDFLSRYDPDPLRYFLTAAGPETQDTDFTWSEFVRRNNDELVANWGNLVNRTLSSAHKNFGAVPEPGELTADDRELLDAIAAGFETVGDLIESARFRAALGEAMRLATLVNRYTDRPGAVGADRERPRAGRNRPLRRAARDRQPEDDLHAVPAVLVAGGARAARQRGNDRRAARAARGRRRRRPARSADGRVRVVDRRAGRRASSRRDRRFRSRGRCSRSSIRTSSCPTSSPGWKRAPPRRSDRHPRTPRRVRGPAVCADQASALGRRRADRDRRHRHRLVPSGARAGRAPRGGLRRARNRPAPGRRRGGESRRRAARPRSSTIEWSPWGRPASTTSATARRATGSAASSRRSSSSRPSSASPSSSIHATRTPTRPTSSPASTARSSCTASRRRACCRRCVERGYYVSFAGNVTYPKATDLRAAAAQVPAERILAETDSPYLAPQARRGRPNEPANVVLTLEALAKARGVDADELGAQIDANAAAAFSLP